MFQQLLNLDGQFLLFLQNHVRNEYLTPVMKLITQLGDAGIFWIALTLVLLFFRKTRKAGYYSAVALICMLVVNNMILKTLVDRTRPYDAVNGLIPLVPRLFDSSFPSGHSAASFAAATALYRKTPKRYGVPCLVLAALIAFSRLYVGVHYPTDVLAGTLVGITLGYMAIPLGDRMLERMRERRRAYRTE